MKRRNWEIIGGGLLVIIVGLVTIWPWPFGHAWSSLVMVGEGIMVVVWGIVDKRVDAYRK